MSPSQTAPPGRLLAQAADEGRTGALVVDSHPGGTVYLAEGAVIYAESPAAPGVGELLTSSGRLAGRTWQAALDAGTSGARVGQLLLDQGHLTRGELELCVLGAIYDAAYFALAAEQAPVEFLDGATHWLGPVVRTDAQAVDREARRRARLLDEIHPHPEFDAAPVIPVPRPPVERVTLTAPQWELLVHADGQRTPADLAQLLGRAGYATIQELRRLAALGLIEKPAVRTAEDPGLVRLPRARGTAVDVSRTLPGTEDRTVPDAEERTVPDAEGRTGPGAGDRAAPGAGDEPLVEVVSPGPAGPGAPPGTGGPPGTVYRPRLARRKPGARLPKEIAAAPPPPHTGTGTGTDEVLLKRIRTALRALR